MVHHQLHCNWPTVRTVPLNCPTCQRLNVPERPSKYIHPNPSYVRYLLLDLEQSAWGNWLGGRRLGWVEGTSIWSAFGDRSRTGAPDQRGQLNQLREAETVGRATVAETPLLTHHLPVATYPIATVPLTQIALTRQLPLRWIDFACHIETVALLRRSVCIYVHLCFNLLCVFSTCIVSFDGSVWCHSVIVVTPLLLTPAPPIWHHNPI